MRTQFDTAPEAAHLTWSRCNASRYDKLLTSLAHSSPRVRLRVAGSPLEGKHILIVGHSYLRQIWDNVLAANLDDVAQLEEIHVSHNISFNGDGCRAPYSLSINRSLADLRVDRKRYSYRWALRAFSFSMVTNFGPLQHSSCLNNQHQNPLQQLLRQLPPVHAIVFMEPHNDCFFKNAERNERNAQPIHCIDLERDNQQVARRCELHSVFSQYVPRVIEVLGWSSLSAVSCGSNTTHLRTSPFVTRRRCELNDCKWGQGHQCNPGTLSLAAEKLLEMLASMTTGL